MPNDLLIMALRRILGLPLLSPPIANSFCAQASDDFYLEHCKNVSSIKRHDNIRDQFKFWLDFNHSYNLTE